MLPDISTSNGCGTAERGRSFAIILTLAVASIAACAKVDTASSDSLTTVRAWRTDHYQSGDTAYARTTGANDPSVMMTLVPEISIGLEDGDSTYLFKAIFGATPTRDSGIMLYDNGARVIRRYDREGKFLGNIGRSGDGPGEYGTLGHNALFEISDGKVLVWAGGSLNVFGPSGSHVGELPERNVIHALTEDSITHHALTLYPGNMSDVEARVLRLDSAAMVRMTLAGVVLDTTREPGARRVSRWFKYTQKASPIRLSTQRLPSSREQAIPLEPYQINHYSRAGYWISGDPAIYSLTLHRRNLPPLVITSDHAQVAATLEERESLLQNMLWQGAGSIGELQGEVADIPSAKPYYKEILSDWDGLIWVHVHSQGTRAPFEVDTLARYVSPAMLSAPKPQHLWTEPSTYDVYTPEGDFLGRVTLPDNATLVGTRFGRLWLRVTDELGVQRVIRYRMLGQSSTPAGEAERE